MPLDTIYLVRHGHRLNWSIDYKTGTYSAQFPTPTGNPADPTLTSHGVRQSYELAAHLSSPSFMPKPFRIYSSPFYRCLQTIQPTVEALKQGQRQRRPDIDDHAQLDTRIENGLGEWFGATSFFDHPPPAPANLLHSHFQTITSRDPTSHYKPHIVVSTRGETITQLHNRVATTLDAVIAEVDTEIATLEATGPSTGKAVLICSHAAPLIAMGRVLTGNMPSDPSTEDFNVFTAGLSTFVRRRGLRKPSLSASHLSTSPPPAAAEIDADNEETLASSLLAEGTISGRSRSIRIPDWRNGKGVGGGWDCVWNGDCSFLSAGAERGWHFNGEESFDTGPMAPESASPTSSQLSTSSDPGSKL